jgi:hypothetical protein
VNVVEDWHAIRTTRQHAAAVYCPTCHAGPGEPCVGHSYRPRTSMHERRHERAVALGAPRSDLWKHGAVPGDGPLRARTA